MDGRNAPAIRIRLASGVRMVILLREERRGFVSRIGYTCLKHDE
jgi:hypothetical protein